MRTFAAALLVFLGGFAIMVLEIVGARFLARDFGSSFYTWVSQIGIVLGALALGYYVGGAVADHRHRARVITSLLLGAGLFTLAIPDLAPRIIGRIIGRHPVDRAIPILWQKLDPAIGSGLIFLFPCCVLAMLAPYMVRVNARQIAHVGRTSGLVNAFSTLGSLAGVVVSGYLLIDLMTLSNIFRASGAVILLLGGLCWFVDKRALEPEN